MKTDDRPNAELPPGATMTNKLKSAFIGIYPLLAAGIAFYSSRQLYVTKNLLIWGGPLATSAPFLALVGFLVCFRNVARTSANLPALNLIAVCGLALACYAVSVDGSNLAPLWLSLCGAVTFFLYSTWYSKLGVPETARLKVGSVLPLLDFIKPDGQRFSTEALRGRPALLMFYRGNWCPLCMAQFKEIAAQYREISRFGARVLLVSPQPHANTAALAKRFDVEFDFLTDTGNSAARRLGIEMKSGLPLGMELLGYDSDTVFPTVIVVDSNGVIRWVDQTDNYRVRPEPETFLPILRELTAAPG